MPVPPGRVAVMPVPTSATLSAGGLIIPETANKKAHAGCRAIVVDPGEYTCKNGDIPQRTPKDWLIPGSLILNCSQLSWEGSAATDVLYIEAWTILRYFTPPNAEAPPEKWETAGSCAEWLKRYGESIPSWFSVREAGR